MGSAVNCVPELIIPTKETKPELANWRPAANVGMESVPLILGVSFIDWFRRYIRQRKMTVILFSGNHLSHVRNLNVKSLDRDNKMSSYLYRLKFMGPQVLLCSAIQVT